MQSYNNKMIFRFGRRPVFVTFTFLQFLMMLFQSFSVNTSMYVVLNFFNGMTNLVNFMSGFVLGKQDIL